MTSVKFSMIASNTSRTRAYLTALEKNQLIPECVVILDSDEIKEISPGQLAPGKDAIHFDEDWPESSFDALEPLLNICARMNTHCVEAGTRDINHPDVLALVEALDTKLVLYSGYGGALLRAPILDAGKRFLHIHGGYLPDFKGSTTNYYSALAEQTVGASAIFLTAEIDGGPVLHKAKFPIPKHLEKLDHVYDSAVRARVLVETLKFHLQHEKAIRLGTASVDDGNTYYVIHPVLKHLAILSGENKSLRDEK